MNRSRYTHKILPIAVPLSDSLTTTTLTPIRDCNFDISLSNNPAFALMLEIRQLLRNARLHLEITSDNNFALPAL